MTTEHDEQDKRVIACNVVDPTPTAKPGALAYVYDPNNGNGSERVQLLIRSRGGRWILKWESMRRLDNFRFKTVPPESPLYYRYWLTFDDEQLQWLQDACKRERLLNAE